MVSQTRPITAEYFNWYIAQPEHIHRNYELIAGEIVEKMVSHPRSSMIAAWMMGKVAAFVDERDLGYVTGADGGYVVSGERYIPDGAFLSKARCPVIPDEAYNPIAPDLALEVLSPINTDEEMRVKVSNYLAAGVVVWLVDPGKRVEVHCTGQPVRILGPEDTLEGGNFLPGFMLAVQDILGK
ncbi:MAG: Uma2 family endonuclease [Anaerolineae bacterium]|nr:Uma2 family endonuclease [Anaerolineae bacterium]